MAKDKGGDGVSNTRKQIEKALQKAEKEKLLQGARKRLDVAMAGVKANEEHRWVDAVKAYHAYLKVLEELKGVGEGGLVPSHFDLKKEVGELLLVVGVYWDLTKIFDHTNSPDKYKEFKGYLDKFMLFSRGLPHEPMCREMLRKYLRRDKPRHAREFREAYRSISQDGCFVATALVDMNDEETLPRLRALRDERLSKSIGGRAFIAAYYRLGPAAAWAVSRMPEKARQLLGRVVDAIAR
ncbi:MAG TPA: CFI-box-CTERM domain-containing protein [Bdellovibrionota bacterium]|nr:CFI-box-CTERM domain-containing protein [Bdellovibrionota bacterium]